MRLMDPGQDSLDKRLILIENTPNPRNHESRKAMPARDHDGGPQGRNRSGGDASRKALAAHATML